MGGLFGDVLQNLFKPAAQPTASSGGFTADDVPIDINPQPAQQQQSGGGGISGPLR